jgi:uncharacterized protein
MMLERLTLGAPGVYEAPGTPLAALTGERMDVCAFVGVTPRGPAYAPVYRSAWADTLDLERDESGQWPVVRPALPVAVDSWSEYRQRYGGFEGPGLLPYAVASFFEQGGRRAYVLRIVHRDASDPEGLRGVATGALAGVHRQNGSAVMLRARNEGRWGNALHSVLLLRAHPLVFLSGATTRSVIAVSRGTPLGAGTLLRVALPGGERELHFVSDMHDEWNPDDGARYRLATLDVPLLAAPQRVEVVEASLSIVDDDPAEPGARREQHERLGLSPQHPRWLAAVLVRESLLVYPDRAWADEEILGEDASLAPAIPPAEQFAGGADRYASITLDDLFADGRWVPGDPGPVAGVQALAEVRDVALVVAADLYSPAPLAARDTSAAPASLANAAFDTCVQPIPGTVAPPDEDLPGLRLDPRLPGERRRIIAQQQRLVEIADALRSFTVLLDVPPGLHQRQIMAWRGAFDSAFAAAYHPWLAVARRDDARDAAVRVNPTAIAAGVIAAREWEAGIPHGPANVLAASVVDVEDRVTPPRHDELHPLGVNVFLRERDGIRLSAARTLARDPAFRQLNVRRLLTMLERVLERQMQWTVFESNTSALRARVRHLLEDYLHELFLANAFRGTRDEEAFFVRCDDELNPRQVIDAGQLIAEIGVAPAEPIEFLVLQIVRDGDGTVRIESRA